MIELNKWGPTEAYFCLSSGESAQNWSATRRRHFRLPSPGKRALTAGYLLWVSLVASRASSQLEHSLLLATEISLVSAASSPPYFLWVKGPRREKAALGAEAICDL